MTVVPLVREFPLDFSRAWGKPPLGAVFASVPEDFIVEEELGFVPDGEGEHHYWHIEKRGLTTEQMLRSIARDCRLPPASLSVAGLKDRQAVTRQWVSIHAPASVPDPALIRDDSIQVLEVSRSRRKLKRGAHRGNHFRIVLRDPRGDRVAIEDRLARIRDQGVPNYFGVQRFGRHSDNIAAFLAWQRGEKRPGNRFMKSLLISSARSWLFNRVVSRRVEEGNWACAVPGDAFNLDGSQSWFLPEPAETGLDERLDELDIHPTGPLWGAGLPPVQDRALALEMAVSGQFPALTDALAGKGLRQERRPLRLRVRDLHSNDAEDGSLVLEFRLDRGAYATSVLRELTDNE